MDNGQENEGRSSDAYRELFEHSADAVLIIEGESFVDCNQAAVDMLRYASRQDVLDTHPSQLSPPLQPDGRDSREKANEMISTAFSRGSHRFEWDHKRADGEVFPVEVLLTSVQRRGQQILHVVWRDITARKHLEEQLRLSQKMEAIGLLAGGIAHDFNNLLVAIIGNADLLSDSILDESLREPVEEILRAGERAADLVRQLLTFSRKQEHRPVVLDLNPVLADMRKLLRRLIGEHLQLDMRPLDEPLLVKVDPNQIEMMLINLATNARDAMAERGILTVELQREIVEEEVIGRVDQLEPGDYAVVAVSDTGDGIDEATLARMFDPFFTTKNVGRGTGLGLAAVYGIANRHGGTVVVNTSPGLGTTMKVYLPVSFEKVLPRPAKMPARSDVSGDETILVVEDEAAVSTLVVNALRSRGYHAILAENGEQALLLWDKYRAKIDLVLTDVVMPSLSGPELVRELRRRGDNPAVLFVSGYTNNAFDALCGLGEEVDLLEKPFSGHELVERVRTALDRMSAEG